MLGQDFPCQSKYWPNEYCILQISFLLWPHYPHTLCKYDWFIFSIHLNDKIKNNILIQIDNQVFAPT